MKIILAVLITFFTFSLQAQDVQQEPLEEGTYINFEITSNKPKVIHAYVKGPKKSGGYFSYGLNLIPFQKRKERWTVGTKLYSENKLGVRKLLYEFTAADEGQVVNVTKR